MTALIIHGAPAYERFQVPSLMVSLDIHPALCDADRDEGQQSRRKLCRIDAVIDAHVGQRRFSAQRQC